MVPLHSQFPNLLVKREVKWKLRDWKQDPSEATKMMRFLVDSLFDRETIKNYTLKEIFTKQKEIIEPIFKYVISKFKLNSDTSLRSSLSDKLSHMPGRTRAKSIRPQVTTNSQPKSSQEPSTEISQMSNDNDDSE